MEHRAATKGLYDKLQQPENSKAKEFLERLLDSSSWTYDEICRACKSSGLFEDVKDITPQDLTRYRQRRAREEQRQTVMDLIEGDAQKIVDAASKNPSGLLAKMLRRQLAEHAIARFDAELGLIDPVSVSRETARHALVEQRDRKLDLEAEKLRIEQRRLELQQQQQDLQKDKFGVATTTWKGILQWLTNEEPTVVEVLTRRSEELLVYLEALIESEAA